MAQNSAFIAIDSLDESDVNKSKGLPKKTHLNWVHPVYPSLLAHIRDHFGYDARIVSLVR